MKKVRLIVIAIAAVCALALATWALARRAAEPAQSDAVIIIKGGSLTIECQDPKNVKKCLTYDDAKEKYKHKDPDSKITKIEVIKRDDQERETVLQTFTRKDFPNDKPEIKITYEKVK